MHHRELDETMAVLNKSQVAVFEALFEIRKRLHLIFWDRFGQRQRIHQRSSLSLLRAGKDYFNRAMPFRKNDNCFIEQKN
ncbi:MAG: hypothetical protein J2P21_06405 [Chloracidobacterium sp.]|nr:hypothetical protein [Chloracidobacterium sp.]